MSNELSRINRNLLPELSEAQPASAGLSLAQTSDLLLSDDSVVQLAGLMAQTQARYPNQVLPEGTPDMYLADWERMVHRYGRRKQEDGEIRFDEKRGLDLFREALLSVIEDRERPRFFPDPLEIEDRIRAIVRVQREAKENAERDADLETRKAQWMREREEEKIHGRQYTAAELALDAKLKAAAAEREAKQQRERERFTRPGLVLTPEEIKTRVSAELARGGAAAAVLVAAVVCMGMLTGCTRVDAELAPGCEPLGNKAGVLSQTWAVANPPQGMSPGNYVVTLSDGEAELAGVSMSGAETLLTVPVPAAQLPAGGIGVNTIQIAGQWVQLGCPAITN